MHPFCRSTTIADFGEETLDKSAGSGIISAGNAMAEIQNRPINSEIAFAKKIRVDPEGVERARKGDNNISYIARHEYGHLLTQYQIKANSRLTIIISRSISKGTKLLSDNPLQYYNGKKYTEKFYHEVCADLLGASKLDAKQLVLKNKILEVIL